MLMLYPVPGAVQIQGHDSYHVSGIAEEMVTDGVCLPTRSVLSFGRGADIPFRAQVRTMRQKATVSPGPVRRLFIFVSFVENEKNAAKVSATRSSRTNVEPGLL
jgi:hypothetical protein